MGTSQWPNNWSDSVNLIQQYFWIQPFMGDRFPKVIYFPKSRIVQTHRFSTATEFPKQPSFAKWSNTIWGEGGMAYIINRWSNPVSQTRLPSTVSQWTGTFCCGWRGVKMQARATTHLVHQYRHITKIKSDRSSELAKVIGASQTATRGHNKQVTDVPDALLSKTFDKVVIDLILGVDDT